eukprot:ANDGO_04237.mRNA.1 hypothetical protein
MRFVILAVVVVAVALASQSVCAAEAVPEKLNLVKFLEGEWIFQKVLFDLSASTDDESIMTGSLSFSPVSEYAIDGVYYENSTSTSFANVRKVSLAMDSESTGSFLFAPVESYESIKKIASAKKTPVENADLAEADADADDEVPSTKWFDVSIEKAPAGQFYVSRSGNTMFRVVSNAEFLMDTLENGHLVSIHAYRVNVEKPKSLFQKYMMPGMLILFFGINLFVKRKTAASAARPAGTPRRPTPAPTRPAAGAGTGLASSKKD